MNNGSFYSNKGILSGKLDAFFAESKNDKSNPKPEDGEVFGDIIILAYQEALNEIKNGEIRDGISLSALQLANASNFL